MTHPDSSHQSSMSPARITRRSRTWLVSIGLALLALVFSWAVVLGYNVVENLPQCMDSYTSPSIMSCNWVNGQMSNANWVEGAAVPQLTQISGLHLASSPVHTYTWYVSWSDKTYYHGYDWMVSYTQTKILHQDYVGAPLDLNYCTSGNPADRADCVALHTSGYSQTLEIPDDTYISGSYLRSGSVLPRIQAFESKYGNRTMTIWTDQPITGTAWITFTHVGQKSGGYPLISDGLDSGGADTSVRYTVYFTSTADIFMLEYGVHFAISGNPYIDPMAWGWDATHNGYGAGGLYPSAPWHVRDPQLDNNAGNIGSQDNQAKVATASLYPLSSNATWNPTTKRATDAVTMTTASNLPITGTVDYWVCGDTTAPYTDTLTYGCTSTTTAIFVGSTPVSFISNQSMALATSPQFSPTVSGRYCFLTIFRPALNGNIYNFAPTSDTNSTTECFMAFGPNAVTVSELTADTSGDGQPIAAILLSLLAVVAGVTVWKLKTRRRQSVP